MKEVSETNLEQETPRFLEDAKQGLDSLKKARDTRLRQETPRFFEGAKQGLGVLGPAIVELDRHLARKFNFFQSIDFFQSIPLKREDRMSNVFAYLLDPDETHGQRDLFLGKFLEEVNVDWLSGSSWSLASIGREVPTTRIENWNRRIDIEIAFQTDDGQAAIAIENKPWADDQPRQLNDYAKHLGKQYKYFRLIYLTPNGGEPSEYSINREKREELENAGKLANASIRNWASDTGWLKRAEGEVKAERVRWFVSDFRKALIESLPALEE